MGFRSSTEPLEPITSGSRRDTEQTDTVLTLYVPAEANVELVGAETEKTGSKRVFTTRQLESGHVWDDYRVRVTVNRVWN